MNQYPGFVPMMVPQHYMVAMPGIPLPPGLQAAHAHQAALQQMIPPSVVPHPGVIAPASVTQPGIALPPGTPMSALGALQQQQDRKLQVAAPEGASPFQDLRQNSFPGLAPMGFQWPPQQVEHQQQQESTSEEIGFILDDYNCDLNLIIDADGCGAYPLNKPSGFCFTWSGARCTYGACRGKIFYEVRVTEHLPTDFGTDHNEENPHILRVGWSIDSSSFQLGEEPWSYGYGGTGKFSSNNKFINYGQRFGINDVIGAMLDLDSRPATISYMKNGKSMGIATQIQGYPVGNKDMALFPHILTKNCRFKVNFGQEEPWFLPEGDFKYIGQILPTERIRGQLSPAQFSECEMIMIIGLPGSGKTTWALNMQKNHPEKRYNIIGSDTLIDKMRVMGLPRKRNYHGRWENLIDKATKCLNKLFVIASKKKRNYILDQTNVYPSARVRKMKNFNGFFRIGAVIQPDDAELERRSWKRTHEDGKFVPEEAVIEMKANYVLPDEGDPLFDRIDYIELPRHECAPLVEQYRQMKNSRQFNKRELGCHLPEKQPPIGGGPGMPPMVMPPKTFLSNQGPSPHQERLFSHVNYPKAYDESFEPPAKRAKPDSGSALDFIKQEYAEDEQAQTYGQAGKPPLKEEARWDRGQFGGGQVQSLMPPGQRNYVAHVPQQIGQPGFGIQPGPVRLTQAGTIPQVTSTGLSMANISQPPPPPPPPQLGVENQDLNPNWHNQSNPDSRWSAQSQEVRNWQQKPADPRPGQPTPNQRNWPQGQSNWSSEQRQSEIRSKDEWQQGSDKGSWQPNQRQDAENIPEQALGGWPQNTDSCGVPGTWQPRERSDLNKDQPFRSDQRKGFGTWEQDQRQWQDNQDQTNWNRDQEHGNWKQQQGSRQTTNSWQQGQDQRNWRQRDDSWLQGQNKWPPQQQWQDNPEKSRPEGPVSRQPGRLDDTYPSLGNQPPLTGRRGGPQSFDYGQEHLIDQSNFGAVGSPRKDGPNREIFSRIGDGRDLDRYDRIGSNQGSDSDMRSEPRGQAFNDRRDAGRGTDRFDRVRSNRDRHGSSQYDRSSEIRDSGFDRRGGSRKFDSGRGQETDKFGREIRSDTDRYGRSREPDTDRSAGRGDSRYGRNQGADSDSDRRFRGLDSDSDRRSRSAGSDRYGRDADRYSRDRGSESERYGGRSDIDRRSNRGTDVEKPVYCHRPEFDRNEGSRDSDQSRHNNQLSNLQIQDKIKPDSKVSAPQSADKPEATAEDRPRRRKSKWDTPTEDNISADKNEAGPPAAVKQESVSEQSSNQSKQMDSSSKSSPLKNDKNLPSSENKPVNISVKNEIADGSDMTQTDRHSEEHHMPIKGISGGFPPQPFQARHPHPLGPRGLPGGPPRGPRHPGDDPSQGFGFGGPRPFRPRGPGPQFEGPRGPRGPPGVQWSRPRFGPGGPGPRGPGGPGLHGPGGPGPRGPGPRPLLSLRGLGPGDRFHRPGGRFPRPF